ncbi:hypothetical protein ABVK25_008013 [Lepraria finkii]|uniref:Uncharacterized protein n=1 Tax=Lepraria finkii TaxID=1340010 RepID=A0ABR4B125_9LECA
MCQLLYSPTTLPLHSAPFPPPLSQLPRSPPILPPSLNSPFSDQKVLVPTRANSIINRLEKTRTISSPDELPAAKRSIPGQSARREETGEAEKKKKEEEKIMRERREEKEREGEGVWGVDAGEGRSNEEGFDDDDFM